MFEAGDGWRYSLWVTNLPARLRCWRADPACIDAAHRVHARVEDCVRTGKDTGIGKFPSHLFALNAAWLAAVLIAAAPAALAAALLTIGPAAPASASDFVAYECQPYNHFGNPDLGSFRACVWLDHATGAWRAAGYVQAIRGVRAIHTTYDYLYVDGYLYSDYEWKAGPAATYLAGATRWWSCSGSHDFGSWLDTWVTWSDGYESATQHQRPIGPVVADRQLAGCSLGAAW